MNGSKSYSDLVAEAEAPRNRVDALEEENKELNKRLALFLRNQNKLESQLIDYETEISLNIEQFRIMADNIPVIVWTANSDGGLDYYNSRWYEYTGQTEEEAIGWGWGPILHPEDIQRTIDTWKRSLEISAPYEIEYRFKRASDNTYRWHLGKAIPVKDKHGRVLKWFGTNTDIQEQKDAENKKDEFISIASHELKTPLTTVKAYIQISKNKISSGDQVFPFIKKAEEQVGRLESLISDLLDVSKLNSGKMMYNIEEFNFNEVVKSSIENIQHTTEKHKIVLRNSVDVLYKGDRIRLEQVMNNLLNNAIKYSPNADQILVTSNLHGSNIIVSVQDYGIGIAQIHLENLFNRFYRVDNSTAKFQGLGLGLYIASEIIKRHNGSFWIESSIGTGSTFYFILPVNGKMEHKELETDNATYYKGSFIEVSYNRQQNYVEAHWLGYQDRESVKKGCLIILDVLKKNNCSFVLNDNSYVIGNWSEAVDWVGLVWFPEMENNGLTRLAWIYSASTFSKLAANKVFDFTGKTSSIKFFTNIQQGSKWLTESSMA